MTDRLGYPIPAWKLVLDGTDLTSRVAPRLVELTLAECRDGQADQLDLRIHDHDGAMALPRRGVTLALSLGWADQGLVDKGTFIVDEVEHSGAPDIISVRARSAQLTAEMRNRRERSWHDTTLGAVIKTVASTNGLTASVAPSLAALALRHLDQANESDVALLTRLGKRYDAVATVKAGRLIFAPIGSGTTPSGKALPATSIVRTDGDNHRFSAADRDSYSGVRAYWNDKKGARRQSVLAGASGNVKALRETFATQATAQAEAESEWKRVQRGTAKLDFTLALGRADVYPEQRVRVTGLKPEIDALTWLIARATHTVTGSGGFTTALEMETAIA